VQGVICKFHGRWEAWFAKVILQITPPTPSERPVGSTSYDLDWSFHSLHGEIGFHLICCPSKKVCQLKKVHLQQFGMIHLPNPDLTYIRNLKRNKIIFMPFHLLETYIRNPSLFFISFFTLPPRGKRRWQPRSARAYMRMGRWVLPSFYFFQVGLPNCWRPIFLVLPKLDGCQVDLSNRWSFSWLLGNDRY
jgi:hypothetical protein